MMRNIIVLILIIVVAIAGAGETIAQNDSASEQEIAALRQEIEALKNEIASLRAQQPQKTFSIGVMPIENACKIPEVGDSFRQILVSTFNEAGIKAVESLDRETINCVLEQDRLVRERVISPVTAPKRGELQGVKYFLFGTVTSYREEEREDEGVAVLGILRVQIGGGYRVKYGRLVVDFRLIDAESGVVVDAFKTEAEVKQKTYGGVVFEGGGAYSSRQQHSMPEMAARSVAEEAAERIAILINSEKIEKT